MAWEDKEKIEQLFVSEPMQVLDQIGAEKGQQRVATAVDDRTEFEKGEKEHDETEWYSSYQESGEDGQER